MPKVHAPVAASLPANLFSATQVPLDSTSPHSSAGAEGE